MIQLTPRVIELLSQLVIEPFYLVQINGVVRLTSYMAPITLSDGREYFTGDLVALDPPRMTSSVDREVYKLSIADPNQEYGANFENGMVGIPVEVRVGFIDQETKLPELDVNNTFVVYKGRIDSVGYNTNLQEVGESIAIISCASPMANLDMSKPFYTSKDYIRQINPDDSSFDQVYEGAGPVQLRWGKV